MNPIYQKPTDLTALLDICYRIAEDAHSGIVRTKKSGAIAYITHPAIVYKLLRLIGINDEITLAATFLHDVIEDCAKFKRPDALKAELVKQFTAAQIPDAEKIAGTIACLCEELTNAEYMQEGKRGWQWEHGQKLSSRAKLIKIADQVASLVDDILLPSDRTYEKMRKFNLKALECAKACSEENELLDKLFKVIFAKAMVVTDGEKPGVATELAERAQHTRQTFSLGACLDAAHQYPIGKRDEPPIKWCKHPNPLTAQTGIVSIGMTDNNNVCQFKALVDPDLDGESPCNVVILSLIQNLEATSPFRVTYQPVEEVNGQAARLFKLKPLMSLGEFIELASQSSAMEKVFSNILSSISVLPQPEQLQR